jgi:hypothetical protein
MPAPSNNMDFDKPAQIGLAEKRMNTKLGNKQEKEEGGKHNLHKKRWESRCGEKNEKKSTHVLLHRVSCHPGCSDVKRLF